MWLHRVSSFLCPSQLCLVDKRMVSLRDIQYQRYHPSSAGATGLYTAKMGLTWEMEGDFQHNYLQFLRRNRSDSLICTASSRVYVDTVTMIWDIAERKEVFQVPSPNTQTSCMDWLSNDDFVTAGHDHNITIWRERQAVGV